MTGPFPFPTRYLDEVDPPGGVHPTEFYSTTDPALDSANHVRAGKRWRQPDNLATPTKYRIWVRNEANSAWALEGSWGIAEYGIGQVPVADEDGYLWPGDVAGEESGGGGIAGVTVSEEGTPVGTRPEINFIGSGDVSILVEDDPGNDRVNVTIDASAESGGGGGPATIDVEDSGTPVGSFGTINFIGAESVTDAGGGVVDVELPAGGGGGAYWLENHPDNPPVSPNTEDDEFDDSSGMSGPNNGLDAKWTQVGGSVTFPAAGGAVLAIPSASTTTLRQNYAPGASTAFTITAKFTGLSMQSVDYYGLQVFDGSNSVIASWDWRFNGSNGQFNRDNPGGGSFTEIGARAVMAYLRLSRDASDNYLGELSFDGITWMTYGIASASSSTTVAKVGVRFGQTASTTWKSARLQWFRRT